MSTTLKILVLVTIILLATLAFNQNEKSSSSGPKYTKDAKLELPENYREWVYLSTGFDMSYTAGGSADHHMFDNVFVSPEAYKAFVATGTWPDKTMLVLEVRGAEGKGSINQKGNYQSEGRMGMEVHVKDEARFQGKWAFFGFDDSTTGNLVPQSAACYSCHQSNGAVDTTFVQFYPTLLPIARSKGTLAATYLKKGVPLAE